MESVIWLANCQNAEQQHVTKKNNNNNKNRNDNSNNLYNERWRNKILTTNAPIVIEEAFEDACLTWNNYQTKPISLKIKSQTHGP